METSITPAGAWRKKWRAWYERAVLVRNPEPDSRRRGRLLAGILLGCLLLLLVLSIINLIQTFTEPGQGYGLYLLENAVVFAALAGLFWLNRRGWVKLAAGIFLVLITLVITLFDPLNTLDRVLLAYAIPVVAASFLVGPVYSFLFALLAAAGYTGFYLTGKTVFTYNYLSVAVLFVFALVSTLIAGQMETMLREARLGLKRGQAARSDPQISEDEFEYVFTHSVLGESITQPSGEISVNRAFCEMLGYSPQELQASMWQEITHPDDIALTQREIDTLLSGEKETVRFTKRYIHKNGSIVWADIGTALRRDQAGQPLYLVTSINDITDRKLAEEKLRESEARYQLIFEHSGTANSIFDMDCRVVLQNSQSQGLTMPADALGKPALEVFGPGQGPIVDERMRRVLASGVAEVFETKFSMPAGTRWIRSSYQPLLDEQHKVVGIQVISQDISAQKQAEELLRETSERLTHMLANSPTVIYALTRAGDQATPIWISENIETVLGFQPEDAMVPSWWLGQVHPQDRPSVQASMEHLFDDFYGHEYRFLRKDGRIIWLHDEHRLLRDEENGTREIIGAWTDITERKQAEEALRDYNARLATEVTARTRELTEAQEKLVSQEKLALLGQLAGSVGHELRNPLGVINNAIYYLKLVQPEADEKIRKYHGVIEQEVHNAEKIITDLLDFARIKSVDQELVAIPALVQLVLERFPVPEYITTVLDLPPDLPDVFVDLRQIEQVLGNLTTNACQAMKEAGQLTVSGVQSKVKGGQWVRINVKDTGTGITPENLKKLFEPLFTTKLRGIGLGLAVSRKLAEANGGLIEVESEVGKGSTFTLYLPVKSLK
ncbi:MAG: PAS domain S-box protein [Anaerolineales bacterium]